MTLGLHLSLHYRDRCSLSLKVIGSPVNMGISNLPSIEVSLTDYLPSMNTTLIKYLTTTYSSSHERIQSVKWMWEWEQE
jgi:hypothetical protein